MDTTTISSWLNPEQAGAYLGGVSVGTLAIWRMKDSKVKIPFVTLGGVVRYRRSDLDEFLMARMSGQPLHRQRRGGSGRPSKASKKRAAAR